MTNYTECGIKYMNDPALIAKWNYTGPVRLITPNPRTQITYEGCKAVCGTGNDWYSWSTSSATITTWILPIIGTLLQAPFESNNFWRTFKASNRWLGSPMATLSYILWNIEVSGKCALFVDMSIPYETPIPDENSDFADMRDSFYLLMNFNQYKLKPLVSLTKEAEGVLRICLFSKDLKLLGTDKTLNQTRRKLARNLRSNRRRGVVPVFISTLWFLFSLGISIQSAFGLMGDNGQAHTLALGLFMSWFPILILCSIVDRNPVASDDIRRKLNKLVDHVCTSLQCPETRGEFIDSFSDLPEAQRMSYWVGKIARMAPLIKGEFFTGFAGQGRSRFHYGAAHAILIDIEKSYLAKHGRGWLSHDERAARANLVLGQVDRGFVWFDGRQFWQISTSVLLVSGTSLGAFILSYNTPTVGLACRSGGYLIFVVFCLGLLAAEFLVWIMTSTVRKNDTRFMLQQYVRSSTLSGDSIAVPRGVKFPGSAASKATLSYILEMAEFVVLICASILFKCLPMRLKRKTSLVERSRLSIKAYFEHLRGLTTRRWLEMCFFTPVEFASMAWLCYMIMAQTFGAFVNCACQTSLWGYGGGYLDFTQWKVSDNENIAMYWLLGVIISTSIMGIGMFYVVVEWCLQAHLSTENYKDAMNGLRRVRRFRRLTFWLRYPATVLAIAVNNCANIFGMRKSNDRNTLVWTKESTYQPKISQAITRITLQINSLPFTEIRR